MIVIGVKRYEPVAVLLTIEGDHVPSTPFGEIVFSVGGVFPEQRLRLVKFGTVIPTTVIARVIMVAVTHSPEFGIKVYVRVPIVDKLTIAGDQVPLIPF